MLQGESLRFLDDKVFKVDRTFPSGPGRSPSITENVENKNILVQERHSHSEQGITVKASRKMQKVELH